MAETNYQEAPDLLAPTKAESISEDTPVDIEDLVLQWRAVRAQRLELKDLMEKLEKGPEAKLKNQIILWLDSQNVDGSKLKNKGGTFSKRTTTQIQLKDSGEKVCERMLWDMLNATGHWTEGGYWMVHPEAITNPQKARPLIDCLLFQKRPLQGELKKLMKEGLSENFTQAELQAAAANLGAAIVENVDLSFTKK